MTNTLTHVWQLLRHAPDRALHRVRRERAMRRIRGRIPKSVLFVCHGNICRSPFAAHLFEQLASQSFPVPASTSSAGLTSAGRGAPPEALAAADKHGVDLSSHISHLLTVRTIRSSDLVVAMSEDQAFIVRRLARGRTPVMVLGDLDPEPIETRTIADPFRGSRELFDSSYARIERCIRSMVEAMANTSGSRASPA